MAQQLPLLPSAADEVVDSAHDDALVEDRLLWLFHGFEGLGVGVEQQAGQMT